jgi:hypothetical protein
MLAVPVSSWQHNPEQAAHPDRSRSIRIVPVRSRERGRRRAALADWTGSMSGRM